MALKHSVFHPWKRNDPHEFLSPPKRAPRAMADAGLGRSLSVGGALGLTHYLDYRTTHAVDAWWSPDASCAAVREGDGPLAGELEVGLVHDTPPFKCSSTAGWLASKRASCRSGRRSVYGLDGHFDNIDNIRYHDCMKRGRTTLYLRGMPVDVVREAKAAAARRGCTLADVVSDALERSLAQARASSPPEPGLDELADEMAWFERNRESLLRKHPGEYLAIVDGAVFDHDPDFEALATRVFERSGVRSVFMPRVERGERRVKLRSPRRVQA